MPILQPLLFTPGPTPIHPKIARVLSQPVPHHRTPEFESIFAGVRAHLKQMTGTAEVLTLVCSGTGAMEAVLCHFVEARTQEPKLLVLNNGKFGERFFKIAQAHQLNALEIKSAWDSPISPQEVLAFLQAHPSLEVLALQACDSSGGLRLDFEGIAKIAKEHNPNLLVVVDVITALGVEPLDVAHVDVLIGGSQKAFMAPVGLGILGLSPLAIQKLTPKGYYFNLHAELANQQKNTTAFTAGISHIIALKAYFECVAELGGLDILFADTKKRALASHQALKALGLQIYPKAPAPSMSTIYHKQATQIRKHLKKYGVIVAGGQDHLKDVLLRINHMGLVEVYEIAWVLNALEQTLLDLGLKSSFEGVAVRVFMQHYY
ncbi:phosphoserine aminotransferase [Helicobacter bizzozeronii CIII-1]|uniref:Phosphoserine aminotransferase n=1 Tax=Helicobacter bizzozeronii (strain CIII-1) TaxID=1002804 RepID=F8KP21_HELBC|nr:alanine--glyoxylate aminotransferase family protein [Helicobacter bizzozeronii]CCB80526.1 phosphoserine aminotransferase [Helicobacter bizzozeronii CIII-1]